MGYLEQQIQKDEQDRLTLYWNQGMRKASKVTLQQLLEIDTVTVPDDTRDLFKHAAWTAGFMAGCLARLQVYYANKGHGVKT